MMRQLRLTSSILLTLCLGVLASEAAADVKLPSIFSSHMVLQQGQNNRVWGTAEAGEKVTVKIGKQSHSATAGKDGRWMVSLDALKTNSSPQTMTVSGKNTVTYEDILVGEVWICSGQSNMAFAVASANDPDLQIATANYPKIRLISVPQVGTQEPQSDFKGEWSVCSPQTVGSFSAAGYFFGRQLHQTLGVPIGLIDNAWGGSACEAWINRDLMTKDSRYDELMARWVETEKTFDFEKLQAAYLVKVKAWQEKSAAARKAGKPVPNRPRGPRNLLAGQHRPGNLYNGVLKPIIGYGIKGAI